MADGAGNPSKGVIRQEKDFVVCRKDTYFKSLANIVEIFLGNPEIETDIPEVLLLRALVYADQPMDKRLRILESFGIKTKMLRKDLKKMETLWDNVAKLNFTKGEKIIRDRLGQELKLVDEGKITNQEFIDRVTALCQEKPEDNQG